MQVVILAGGRGTRLMEETHARPKPMVEIGGKPMLWHIMKHYQKFGINDFIVCTGYMAEMIDDYLIGNPEFNARPVYTGEDTGTGGRLLAIKDRLTGTFCMTYGDGVSTVDIKELKIFHAFKGKKATLTAVRPPARFGALDVKGDYVKRFREKPSEGYVNGGFFILEPEVIDLIPSPETSWEKEPLEKLAQEGELCAFKHNGFWKCMDMMRDRVELEKMYAEGNTPWL